jgi:ribosomal protein S18 acetylase RimI-like enzyme
MTPCTIQRAGDEDLEALTLLFDAYRQFYDQPSDTALARRFLAKRLSKHESVIWLAFDAAQKPQGFCQIYPSFCSLLAQPVGILYDLFVAASARRMGLARALLLNAQAHASAQGWARLDLSTACSNAPAQALYTSLGWQRDTVFWTYSLAIPANATQERG